MWLASHLFAVVVIVSFVFLGFWQLSRHGEKAEFNEEVGARSGPPAASVEGVLGGDPEELDYRYVSGTGEYVDGDVVRVANRTQGGTAGQYLVGLFRLSDGRLLLVNRGFVPLNTTSIEIESAPAGPVTVVGWLRQSAERGLLGPTDSGEGDVVPRFDVAAIEARLAGPGDQSGDVADVWLQLEGGGKSGLAVFPDPVPLPPLDGGPHLSYMGQWFIFAILGTLFYGALLRRIAHGKHRTAASAVPDPV